MENDKLKKFIKTTIREFLNENKYMDDVLDRMNQKCYDKNCDDGIYKLDKEYLRRLKSGEDVSDIEKQYDDYKDLKDEIFKERPVDTKNWDFILIDDLPLWYDKKTKEIKRYSETIFFDIHPNFVIYLGSERLEKEPMQGMLYDILMDIYGSEDLEKLKKQIHKRFKEYSINNGRINGSRWIVVDDYDKLELGTGYTPDKNYNYSFLGIEYLIVKKRG